MEAPLPWERVLWTGRPLRIGRRLRGERYLLTDFRLVRIVGASVDELVLHDIGDVQRHETGFDRLVSASTLVVRPRRRDPNPAG